MSLWKLPCAFNARSQSLVLRACLERLGHDYAYEQGTRHFTRFTFVITLDRFARTFRYEVSAPVVFHLEAWDETPGHGGPLHFLEVGGFSGPDQPVVTTLLQLFAASLPRPPWKFTLGQKLSVGLLQPELLRARKRWERAGVTLHTLEEAEGLELGPELLRGTSKGSTSAIPATSETSKTPSERPNPWNATASSDQQPQSHEDVAEAAPSADGPHQGQAADLTGSEET